MINAPQHIQNTTTPFYNAFLRSQLQLRCNNNPRYSLRAFARQIQIAPGVLSSILNAKRPLTIQMAERILERLNVDPEQHAQVMQSVVQYQLGRRLLRLDPRVRQLSSGTIAKAHSMEIELYHMVADWYHAAILELTYSDDFQCDPKWVSKILGISFQDAKSALDRLIHLELLQNRDGKIVKANDHLVLQNPYHTSSARKRKQKQIRLKAIEAIENDPVDRRYMSATTMNIDPDLLPEARRRIDEFSDSLCAFLESGKRKEVYALELGLFSLQKIENTKSTIAQENLPEVQ